MAMGEHHRVVSSNVFSVAYDPEEQVMAVRFNSGGLYVYYEVDESVFDAFLAAPSKGRFLWRNVRGVYDYERTE